MKKPIILLIISVLVLIAISGIGIFKLAVNGTPVINIGATSEKDATYKINGEWVTLKNGVAEVPAAPGSASMITTRYFGNSVSHDFDGDGRPDVAFLLTQETGGSGTFYYLVAALNTANGYVGSSDAVLLGDRIAPQPTTMGKGNIIITNYADRGAKDSFAVRPYIGKSRWFLFDPQTMTFGEVAQNFEGEADPSRMTLSMQPWHWVNTVYNNDMTITPKSTRFVLTLRTDGSFSATTDCNTLGGTYTVSGGTITFGHTISTKMACQNSQEGDFTKGLMAVQSYHFTSRGELVFDLAYNSGVMMFK